MREYVFKHYRNLFKRALKRHNELTVNQLIEELKLPSSTVRRYLEIFLAMGILKERKEGKNRLISLK